MASQIPVIGNWYQDAEQDEIFEVVAVDDAAGTVEIQYLEGEVSELDVDSWKQMILLPAKPPEDFNIAYEMSSEDIHEMDEVFIPESWDNPLSSFESDSFMGSDEYY